MSPSPATARTAQDASAQVRQVVPAVLRGTTYARSAWGAVSAASGQSCTLTVSGTPIPVVALRPYTPTNGDTALGLWIGSDLFLIGAQ